MATDSFDAGRPLVLRERPGFMSLFLNGQIFADCDVAPDGRFMMFQGEPGAIAVTHIQMITGWFDDLRRTFSRNQ